MNLINELEDVCQTMSSLHIELAQIQAAETRGKIEGQFFSEEHTVTGREHYASFQVVDLTTDRLKLQGELNALRERQKFLLAAIGERSDGRET